MQGAAYLVLDVLGALSKAEGAQRLGHVGEGWADICNHHCLRVASKGVLYRNA